MVMLITIPTIAKMKHSKKQGGEKELILAESLFPDVK